MFMQIIPLGFSRPLWFRFSFQVSLGFLPTLKIATPLAPMLPLGVTPRPPINPHTGHWGQKSISKGHFEKQNSLPSGQTSIFTYHSPLREPWAPLKKHADFRTSQGHRMSLKHLMYLKGQIRVRVQRAQTQLRTDTGQVCNLSTNIDDDSEDRTPE